MSTVITDDKHYSDIAAAIRSKNGSTTKYKPSDMPAAISAIETGGDSLEDEIITHTVSGTYSNDRIATVGKYAFYDCSGLTEIDLPNATTLLTFAFQNCSKLENIILPRVTYIAEGVFYGTAITAADFPLATYVGSNCFYNASKLLTVSLPLVTSILDGTFRNSNVQTAELWATSIARTAFTDAKNLETLIIRTSSVCAIADISVALRGSKIANGTGYVYVHDDLVDDYKAAANWTAFADQIKPISELEATT